MSTCKATAPVAQSRTVDDIREAAARGCVPGWAMPEVTSLLARWLVEDAMAGRLRTEVREAPVVEVAR